MPYPNEHAARVKNPGLFEEGSFRSKDLKPGIRIIIGKLKGEDSMTVQTYRFSAEKFTVDQAKQWLKDHKITYLSFEPAKQELAHYGVLGMKWGVRKKRGPSSSEHTETSRLRGKSKHELSNKELQTVIDRLRLEKQFSQATASPGKKAVGKVLGTIGTATLGVAAGAIGKAVVDGAIKKAKG